MEGRMIYWKSFRWWMRLKFITRVVCARSFNRRAMECAEKYHVAGTVGSDAHAAFELGRSLVLLEPFEGPDELRKVIRNAKYQTRWSPPWIHLTSRYATLRKRINFRLDTPKRA